MLTYWYLCGICLEELFNLYNFYLFNVPVEDFDDLPFILFRFTFSSIYILSLLLYPVFSVNTISYVSF